MLSEECTSCAEYMRFTGSRQVECLGGPLPNHIQDFFWVVWVTQKSDGKVPKSEATFKQSFLGLFLSFLRALSAQNTPLGLSFPMVPNTWALESP